MGRKKTSVGGKTETTPAQRLKTKLSNISKKNKTLEKTLIGLQSLKGIKTEISKADSRTEALKKAITNESKSKK